MPLETDHFLRLAIDITVAVGKLHRRGLLHKDIKPANIMVNCPDGLVRLTGFGIASRVPRERQSPEPPETVAGTLACTGLGPALSGWSYEAAGKSYVPVFTAYMIALAVMIALLFTLGPYRYKPAEDPKPT